VTWHIGVISFDTWPEEAQRFGGKHLTNSLDSVRNWFNRIPHTGGASENAVNGAMAALQYERTGLSQFHVIIIGDEGIQYLPGTNCPWSIPQAAESLRAVGAVVDAFPINGDTQPSYEEFATATGGITRLPGGRWAENLMDIVNGLVVGEVNGVLVTGTTPNLTVFQEPLTRTFEVQLTYHGHRYNLSRPFSLLIPNLEGLVNFSVSKLYL